MSEPEPLPHAVLDAGEWSLVEPDLDHAASVLALFEDDATRRWNPAPLVVDLASAEEWIERSRTWGVDWAVWNVVDRGGRFVGSCTLWRVDRTDQLVAEVGYRTAPWARGRGVATAAVRAMARWCFDELGLERVGLVHAIANPASCVVADRAGFTLEATLRREYRTSDGLRWDTHVHGLLRDDPSRP